MAHAFFAVLEREPDFLTLVEPAFSFTQPLFAGTGKTGIYESNFDLRYSDQLFTAVESRWRQHLLCLSFSIFRHDWVHFGCLFARHSLRDKRDMTNLFASNTSSRAALTICGG